MSARPCPAEDRPTRAELDADRAPGLTAWIPTAQPGTDLLADLMRSVRKANNR